MAKILGIDPGTCITGYALITLHQGKPSLVDFGTIRPPANRPLADRYLILYDSLVSLISTHTPQVAIESPYVDKNPKSTLKLGIALGMAMLAARQHNCPFFEYSPTQAKKAVTGTGRASKEQVQGMLQAIFRLPSQTKTPSDAFDALALALCHAHVL